MQHIVDSHHIWGVHGARPEHTRSAPGARHGARTVHTGICRINSSYYNTTKTVLILFSLRIQQIEESHKYEVCTEHTRSTPGAHPEHTTEHTTEHTSYLWDKLELLQYDKNCTYIIFSPNTTNPRIPTNMRCAPGVLRGVLRVCSGCAPGVLRAHLIFVRILRRAPCRLRGVLRACSGRVSGVLHIALASSCFC